MESQDKQGRTSREIDPGRRALLGALGAAAAPVALASLARAGTGASTTPTLVTIFLRGALDGLSFCAPTNDTDYISIRGSNALPPVTGGSANPRYLDPIWGLSSAALKLRPIYDSGDLAFVHGCGVPHGVRSHFEAMDLYERMDPDRLTPGDLDGAVAKLLDRISGTALLRACAEEKLMPKLLRGSPKGLAIETPLNFDLPGYAATASARKATLDAVHAVAGEPISSVGQDSLAVIDLLGLVDPNPGARAAYPPGLFGDKMHAAAQVIKDGFGLQSLHIDYGGWDDHADQGQLAAGGKLYDRLTDLCDGLSAFHQEMSSAAQDYTLLVFSEFGRRVAFNGSGGTDHGSGNAMLVMGQNVNGGQVYTDSWTGLAGHIDPQGDLKMTLDARDVWSEVFVKHMGLTSAEVSNVFPGYTYNPRGIVT